MGRNYIISTVAGTGVFRQPARRIRLRRTNPPLLTLLKNVGILPPHEFDFAQTSSHRGLRYASCNPFWTRAGRHHPGKYQRLFELPRRRNGFALGHASLLRPGGTVV